MDFKSDRFAKRKHKNELLQPCSTKSGKLARNEEDSIDDSREKNKPLEVSENHLTNQEEEIKDETSVFCGIPLPLLNNEHSKSRVTFVLEKASLTLAYVGKKYQILNSDEHADFLRKKNKNPYHYRPEILHQVLFEIMNSRLCKVGRVKAVYIKTNDGQLIKVEPNTNIQIAQEDFYDMMAQLLQKLHVKGRGFRGKLLSLVQNPVTKYLPANALKIGLSYSSEKKTPIRDYLSGVGIDQELVFVVGVMAHGKIECDYVDGLISICGYHLSAANCLEMIFTALERRWDIL